MYAKIPDHEDEVRRQRLYEQLKELGFRRGHFRVGSQTYDAFRKDRKEIRIIVGLCNPLTEDEIAAILDHANSV
jgi:hypothetical protein